MLGHIDLNQDGDMVLRKYIEVMDFGFIVNAGQDIRLVNISKFGAFWSLVCNNRFLVQNTCSFFL